MRFLRAAARHCRSRAVRASAPPALRPAREVLRLSATPRRGQRLRTASREARPGLSFGKWPRQAPRWSAERRARPAGRAASPEAQMDGNIRCVARPHETVAPIGAPPPLIFWRQKIERSHYPPRDSGGGGPLELAKRANRGGGGAGRGASFSLRKVLFAEEARKNVRTSRRLLRHVESCAPSTTLLRRVAPLPRCRGGG